MLFRTQPVIALALSTCALSACAPTAGDISRDAEPFEGIAPTAEVYLGGTEPFWGLDIIPDSAGYTARFSTPDDIDGSSFEVARFAGNNGVGFSGELGERAVQISLTPGDCSDGMSDRSYPYIATVALGDATLYGCAHTSDEPFSGEEMP